MTVTRRAFLKTAGAAGASVALGGASTLLSGCGTVPQYDVLIQGGTVVDGSGGAPYPADVGITGGKIVEIGALDARGGKKVIDAGGMMVAPGFIDIHSHTDLELLILPRAESKIRQGVTTEVAGQDGDSYAPLTEEALENLRNGFGKRYGVEIDWKDFPGFFDRLERQRIGVNFISFVGQGTIRGVVVGQNDVRATPRQIDEMKGLVGRAMEEGAWALSSGLEYNPGSFADKDEIAALCRTAQSYGGIYATHIRNEDNQLLESIDEAIETARAAGIGLQISHVKAEGRRNWDKIGRVFERVDKANAEGMDITLDRYPYIAYATTLQNLFPIWSRDGGTKAFVKRLQDPRTLARMKRAALANVDMLGDWSAVMITSVGREKNKQYEGKRVSDITASTKKDPFAFVRQLMIEEEGRVGMIGFGMSEEELRTALTHPLVMIASDGGTAAPYGPLSKTPVHPRYYGTFPRVLGKYCREEGLFDFPTAVYKMTGLPARRLGLKDRGRIDVGYAADVVVFNPETVIDRADFIHPHQYPVGIDHVLVNGTVVIDDGEHTGALPGKVLRRGASVQPA